MDRMMRAILTFAIAVLYPVVLYFSVLMVLPRQDTVEYPSYPNCRYSNYDSSLRSYRTSSSCQQEQRAYEEKKETYQQQQEAEDDRMTLRAQIVTIVAVVTIIGALFIRDVKEVSAGLVLGSALALMIAISYALSSTDSLEIINSLLAIVAFAVLTGLLYVIDRQPDVFQRRQSPPAPDEPNRDLRETSDSSPSNTPDKPLP